ncbi:hypothetical protein COU77_04225 [Candidatus Peregrinibacteria bacterium CG10_big_fil_rev_8_21_14_0_10_49_16]|nr:MAG: hypothetical protein COW95_01540 [Candidatus Peregrinibacteria bacterium CG22_combo_CG10-13_8_21_14_all_49_11]PIR51700.1 MAG: hypothetical protein COU77_04225 [Candidatus Peregrinibacteria bacterium CG10_big_fil_rev_8_21_14_0_10_49_16]
MNIDTLIIIGVLIGCTAFIVLRKSRSPLSGTEEIVQKKDEYIGELKQQVAELRSENDRMSGEGKQFYAQNVNLEKDMQILRKENEKLQNTISKHEATAERKEKEHQDALNKLHTSEESWKQERARVQREDDERRQKQLEEWDHMWKEHEDSVKSLIFDLCKKPDFNFVAYDSNNLPEGFYGKLKPDCMIAFLEQYVIFDAKISSSKNLQTYINDQVKSTTKKVKGNEIIYPAIFLVIPTEALKQLKKTRFYEDGFSFFVISPEAIPPILASFKKIENYEFAEQMDPQQRENIVDLIAQFDFHISSRNAVDFALMQHGLETLGRAKNIDPALVEEIAIKKSKMRNLNLNTAEQKRLTTSPEAIRAELKNLTNPQPQMQIDDV